MLRLWFIFCNQACASLEQLLRQPQLRNVRKLAAQRAALERRALKLQQQEQELLRSAGPRRRKLHQCCYLETM